MCIYLHMFHLWILYIFLSMLLLLFKPITPTLSLRIVPLTFAGIRTRWYPCLDVSACVMNCVRACLHVRGIGACSCACVCEELLHVRVFSREELRCICMFVCVRNCACLCGCVMYSWCIRVFVCEKLCVSVCLRVWEELCVSACVWGIVRVCMFTCVWGVVL